MLKTFSVEVTAVRAIYRLVYRYSGSKQTSVPERLKEQILGWLNQCQALGFLGVLHGVIT